MTLSRSTLRALGVALLTAASWLICRAQQPVVQPSPLQPRVIRSWGNDEMRSIMAAWQQAFRRAHPEVTFQNTLLGSGSGMAGIITGTSDLSLMGRRATVNEIKGFEWVFRYKPLGIEVMTGGLQGEGKSAALAVFVSASNPIRQITMAQLADILDCPSNDNITPIWALAGVTGPHAVHTVHAYIPAMSTNTGAFLQAAVQGDGDCWNWNIVKEFSDVCPQCDRNGAASQTNAGQQIVAALKSDPDGLAISTLDHAAPGIKTLPVAATGWPAVVLSPEALIAGSYPLTRELYIYINRRKDKAVDPTLKEFLRFVLSPEGQALIPQNSSYLPLSAANQMLQLEKLE